MHIPKLRVLIPVHNGELYLPACLDSVLSSTFTDFHILVYDDGSTDTTRDIIQRYCRRHPCVQLLHGDEQRGLAHARNQLCAAGLSSDSQYICFVDGDDIVHAERFEYQIQYMDRETSIDVAGCSLYQFTDTISHIQRVIPWPETDGDIKYYLARGTALPICAVIMRTASLRALRRLGITFNEQIAVAEDYDYWTRVAPHVRFANIQKPLYYYRTHDNQLSQAHRERMYANHTRIATDYLRGLGIVASEEEVRLFAFPSEYSPFQVSPSVGRALYMLVDNLLSLPDVHGATISSNMRRSMRASIAMYIVNYDALWAGAAAPLAGVMRYMWKYRGVRALCWMRFYNKFPFSFLRIK